MRLLEREFDLPAVPKHEGLLGHLAAHPRLGLPEGSVPLRFVVTGTRDGHYHVELGLLQMQGAARLRRPRSIFDFRRRPLEVQETFTAVMLVPTGIGAVVGGHAGDAGPAARLLSACCDRLITHPNVVNAADINEMPQNALYVEGSVVTRLLMGTAALAPRRLNRILTIIDRHEAPIMRHNAVNAVNAARGSAGFACERVEELPERLTMSTHYSSGGRATGVVEGLDALCRIIAENASWADAVAMTTVIDMDADEQEAYFTEGALQSDIAGADEPEETVNGFGGVEAMLTHCTSSLFDLPTAHAPMYDSVEIMNSDPGYYEPRKAAEAVSVTFLHSVLKGLARSPAIVTDAALFARPGVVSAEDVSCLVIPDGCLGLPTLAALEQGVAVIAVKGNKNAMANDLSALPWRRGQFYRTENYWEAAGVMAALRAGVPPSAVRRPLDGAELRVGSGRDADQVNIDVTSEMG